MKSLIIYFSQTGNTKKIALAIQKGINQAIEQCSIAAIKEIDPIDLVEYDLIGLGSPVWRRSVPANVLSFIDYGFSSQLQGKHGFVFCTHGTIPGGFIPSAVTALNRKGLKIIGWNDWYGSIYLQSLPKPYYTDGHPDEIDLKEAEFFGSEVANRSRRIFLGETSLIPELPKTESEWAEIYGAKLERVPMPTNEVQPTSLQAKINMEKCTECMLCADHCPTNSIDFSVSPPIFMNNCIKCFFCELICPEGAIEVDWSAVRSYWKKVGRPRIEKQLEIDKAKGRFRPLVPFDYVNWDTPFFEKTGHPRFQI